MKVCQYCGRESEDSAQECKSCGASAFDPKCARCGTVITKGMVCPNCALSLGAEPIETKEMSAEAPKKRKTWLWILGWIFIFPIPVTILMVRTQKISKLWRIVIAVLAWLIYLRIGNS